MSNSKILTIEQIEELETEFRKQFILSHPGLMLNLSMLVGTVRHLLEENEQLTKGVVELQNALLPFALLDIRHLNDRPDTEPIWAINKSRITNGHIRSAQRLILRSGGEGD